MVDARDKLGVVDALKSHIVDFMAICPEAYVAIRFAVLEWLIDVCCIIVYTPADSVKNILFLVHSC